ncbi:MAG: glutaminase A [Solirubrobacteraceae bacterium]|nr:glutaminase A [Solirubrobacteraceae bacterium]
MTESPVSPVQAYLEGLLGDLQHMTEGEVADYIPSLAEANPDRLGIGLATVDGALYAAGDHDVTFSIQSMSKPFTYALALADRGFEIVDAHVGVEPTGDAFNSISLEEGTGRPRNPMINAGAITATSLVSGDRNARILDMYSACAGRPLGVEEDTYAGERDTGHRNRAISHMLRAYGILDEDPEPILDAYFRQCAVAVDAKDVALMAATLANGGVHPVTGERILHPDHVRRVLSVMTTCGMYDAAGDWLVGVGLPAKSGVAGGVMAVLPGQLGVCVFSPRLDAVGNSVRGVAACRRISAELGLHSLKVARATRSSVRARFDLTMVTSRRRRPAAERERLAEIGTRCAIYELQGDLVFGAIERVIRDVVANGHELDVVVLDLTRTSGLDAVARRRFIALAASMQERDKSLVIATRDVDPELDAILAFDSLDAALEWAEWEVLGIEPTRERPSVTLETHPLTAPLTREQRDRLAAACEEQPFAAGDMIIRTGDEATHLFLLMRGEVSVKVEGTRLSTLLPGAFFGEMALHGVPIRSADIIADQDGVVLTLPIAAFEEFARTGVALQAGLLRGLLESSNEIVIRLTKQVAALS